MRLSGKKRSRNDDDYLEILPPAKKKVFRQEPAPRLRRSNSIGPDGGLLPISDRFSGNKGLKKEAMKDYSVMAVFSREAFENFSRKFKSKMSTDTVERATKGSRTGVAEADMTKMFSRQSTTIIGTDFQAQVEKLLENKTSPQVITVIEGKEEAQSLSIKTKVGLQEIDVPYTRMTYIQGTNAKGSSDNKQSMSVYVRNDMLKVYGVSEEVITHSPGKRINAVGINYATEDGTRYRSLAVHIPNEFIGSQTKNEKTHQSFIDYAAEQKKLGIVVTSYFGDTNYASAMTDYSVPSIGGQMADGRTLSPQSSSAQKDTNFMQSIPLTDGGSKHSVLQPSVLNSVFITPDDTNREAVDHPSILQYVAHDSPLSGKTEDKLLMPLEYGA
jgi:hypothetical protein